MKNIALITGGSSGIGFELARIHASRGGDLVLVASDAQKLAEAEKALQKEHEVQIKTIAVDLSQDRSAEIVYAEIKKDNLVIDFLMNNAGFGSFGKFYESDPARDLAMLSVNVNAVVSLTRLILPDMVARHRGRILNVASSAGFIPGPMQAVYHGTKAFMVSWSQAIAAELSGTKITVTCLCPSQTRTGFAKAAGMEKAPIFQGRQADSKTVARQGYEGMLAGKLVVINNRIHAFLLRFIVPLMPRKMVLYIYENYY